MDCYTDHSCEVSGVQIVSFVELQDRQEVCKDLIPDVVLLPALRDYVVTHSAALASYEIASKECN